MNRLEARRISWELGLVASWYLRSDQIPVYKLLHHHQDPFIECSRRYGKTTSILTFVLEMLRRNPGWVCRWCEPNKNQAREIVIPEMKKLQSDCPKHLRFQWTTTDSVFIGPGESRLFLRGVNEDRGESARGAFANIIVCDEYGTWVEPEYIVESILRPQLDKQEGQHLIIASTPPKDLGHLYYDKKIEAIREGRFIQRTIYDDVSLTPEEIEKRCKKAGGPNSAAWRREYLCEPVSDPESLVIPEYKEDIHDVEQVSRPSHFDTYVAIDLGLNDCTAFLFGYYDFLETTLVIEDEWVANGKNTQEIVEAAQAKEKSLWADRKPYRRIGDNELQQLYDMQTIHGYSVLATRKDDKLAAINALRLRFSQGKIKIHKRCEALRFQLKVGLWNDRRTDFVRGEKTGHLDAVDALIYLNRNLDIHHNPFPPLGYGTSRETTFVNPQPLTSPEGEVLKRALRPFR